MKTPQKYIESIRNLKLNVYIFGKRVENVVDDPIIRPSLNAVAMTYSLAMKPEEDYDFQACGYARKTEKSKKVGRSD